MHGIKSYETKTLLGRAPRAPVARRRCPAHTGREMSRMSPGSVQQVSQLVGQVGGVGRRHGVRDPVDDVEDDEGERKRSSRQLVDVASSSLARLDVDRRRVRDFGRQAPVTHRL